MNSERTIDELLALRDELRRRIQAEPRNKLRLTKQLSEVEQEIDRRQGQATLF